MILLDERLRLLRAEKQKTQQDMADFLGIRVRSYQCYEHKEHYPPLDALITLADFFQVSLDYLVGRSDVR